VMTTEIPVLGVVGHCSGLSERDIQQ